MSKELPSNFALSQIEAQYPDEARLIADAKAEIAAIDPQLRDDIVEQKRLGIVASLHETLRTRKADALAATDAQEQREMTIVASREAAAKELKSSAAETRRLRDEVAASNAMMLINAADEQQLPLIRDAIAEIAKDGGNPMTVYRFAESKLKSFRSTDPAVLELFADLQARMASWKKSHEADDFEAQRDRVRGQAAAARLNITTRHAGLEKFLLGTLR